MSPLFKVCSLIQDTGTQNCKPSSSVLYQSKSPPCFSLLSVISEKMCLYINAFIHFQMEHNTPQISATQFHSQPPDWGIWLRYLKIMKNICCFRICYYQKQIPSETETFTPSLLSFLTAPTHRSGVKCCSPELHYWWAFLNSLLSLAPCTVNQSLWAKHFNKEIFLSTSKFEQISTSYYRFLHKTITSCPIHSRNF